MPFHTVVRAIEEQVRRDREAAVARGDLAQSEFTELKRENDDDKGTNIILSIPSTHSY